MESSSARRANLRRLLSPSSIAVIGASASEEKAGYQAVKVLEQFEGEVWPINPQASVIAGRKAYKSLSEIGQPADLAILAIPAQACATAIGEAIATKCGGALIVSGGFGETGADGGNRQNELEALVDRSSLRLLGPNTSGFINPRGKCTASFVPGLHQITAGKVAVIAQSGGVNLSLAFMLQNKGVGVSLAVGLGNAVDVDTPDVLEYLQSDDNTNAVIIHLEGIAKGRELYDAVRRIIPSKPVVALLAGKAGAAEFAQSHTGKLLGSFDVKKSALRQAGAVVVESLEDAVDSAIALSMKRLPAHSNPSAALVTGQAGPALLFIDTLTENGTVLSKLAEATREKLKTLLPPLTFTGNPVDTGRPGPSFPAVLETVSGDSNVQVTAVFAIHEPAAIDLLSLRDVTATKPILFGTLGNASDVHPVRASMNAAQIPCFLSPEALAKAVSALAQDAISRARLQESGPREASPAEARFVDGRSFDEVSAKALIEQYGIQTPKRWVCKTVEEALIAFKSSSGKVVAKILSDEIAHKTEVGGVIVGISSSASLAVAIERLSLIPLKGARRYLIEEMAEPGTELIVGAVRDKVFGPTILVGLGGVTAEIFKDTASRMAPVSILDAMSMIEDLKSKELLDGFRGRPKVDKKKIAQVLVQIGLILLENADIEEIEINPLRITEAGSIVALDSLVVVSKK